MGFVLVDRDLYMLRYIECFRFCLGRHIKHLVGFDGQRACDRRLTALIEAGYLDRKKVLYGVPSVYYLTYKGKMLIGANKRQDKIRIEKINHDIAVVDTAIFFHFKRYISLRAIISEKELYSKNGFGKRKHFPDFVFEENGNRCCVEIELTAKAKSRFAQIVEDNYLNFEMQYWIVSIHSHKIKAMLDEQMQKYPNIEIIDLEEVQKFVRLKQ